MDEIIKTASANIATPAKALTFTFIRRLKDMGVPTVPGDHARIERRLAETLPTGRVELPISKRRFNASGLKSEEIKRRLEEAVTDEELKAFEEMLSAAISGATKKAISALARAHGEYLDQVGNEILQEHRAFRDDFLVNLRRDWGHALSGYEIHVEIAREIGRLALQWTHKLADGPQGLPNKVEAISKLYGRACQIADEVGLLLANGFADGAHARWRSLHEVQVVMHVLADGDDDLAERYLCHHDIDLYHEAKALLPPGTTKSPHITQRQMQRLQQTRDALLAQFGKDFDATYGWASALLGCKASRFVDLEARAGATYLRSHYKGASANVHATARGVLAPLGLPQGSWGILAGASNLGFAKPAIGSIHSLVLCALSLATFSGSSDVMAKVMAMQKLGVKVDNSFRLASRQVAAKAREIKRR